MMNVVLKLKKNKHPMKPRPHLKQVLLRHLVRLSPRALGQLGQLGPSGPWRSRGEKHGMLSPKVIGVNMIKTMWGPCFLIAKLVNITSIALVHECL